MRRRLDQCRRLVMSGSCPALTRQGWSRCRLEARTGRTCYRLAKPRSRYRLLQEYVLDCARTERLNWQHSCRQQARRFTCISRTSHIDHFEVRRIPRQRIDLEHGFGCQCVGSGREMNERSRRGRWRCRRSECADTAGTGKWYDD